SVGAQVLFYLGAVAGLGVGTGILAETPNIPDANDLKTTNPVGRTGAYVIGGLQLAAGAVLLGLGIGTTVRGMNSTKEVGVVDVPVTGTEKVVDCSRKPVVADVLLVKTATASVVLGRTDSRGRLVVPWSMLQPLVAELPGLTSLNLMSSDGHVLGAIADLAPAR